jgi:cation diffusion facilitator CzcD-associated flavoprotein CzcO
VDELVVVVGAGPAGLAAAGAIRPSLEPIAGHLVALDRHGMPPHTGPVSSPQHPGLWFFGLDRSIYGNMHIHRRQARQLARAIIRRP